MNFSTTDDLPDDCILIDDQVIQYHEEHDNIFYGDQVYVKDGAIHAIDRGIGDALFDRFYLMEKIKY